MHLIGKLASVLGQPINPDVAAIEAHLLGEHPKRAFRRRLSAGLRPQRIAQLQQESLMLPGFA